MKAPTAPKTKKAKSDAVRQADRNERIVNAGLKQRKVVAHEDDFAEVRAYAEKLWVKRGIDF